MKVRFSFKQIIELHDAHFCKEMPGTGPHYELLQEHCNDFCIFFQKFMDRGNKHVTVTFSRLQQRALLQLWYEQPLPPNAGAYVIQDIIKRIDQERKQLKITTR